MNILKCSCVKNFGDLAPLVLRIAAGIIFILHGWTKLGAMNNVVEMLSFLNIPSPEVFAWVITILEVAGGIALILGLLTHWASKLLAIEMLIAVLLVGASKGIFDQPAFMLFAIAFSLMITGAGKWSLDEWVMKPCCGKCVDGICPEHGGSTVK